MPSIVDDGVTRPLRDFNIVQDTTIYLVVRLVGGGRSIAPYRREDWFPPAAQLEEARRQLEILDIDDGGRDDDEDDDVSMVAYTLRF